MRGRVTAPILVAIVLAAAQPRLQTPAHPAIDATSDDPSALAALGEIVRYAVARAASQDEAKTELWFESLVETTVESLNGDGEITGTETTLHRRYPVEGAVYEELIERDGEPLNEPDARQEETRRAEFRREAREAAANGEVPETNDERQVRFDEDLMARYDAEVVGEEMVRGERCWVISFAPRDGKLPANTRIDKALNQSSGELYVSQEDYGVIQVDFSLLRPVRYVWGLVASLSQATGRLEFERVEPDVWLPSLFELRVDIRLLFRTQRRRIVREWRERQRITGDTGSTLETPPIPPRP